MKRIEIGRPVGASLWLGALLATAGIIACAAWGNLIAAEEEQQAKSEFVTRDASTTKPIDGLHTSAAPPRLAVEADSETLAAAQIDATIRSTAGEAGGAVLSSRADAKHEDKGVAGRIEVSAVVEGSNDVLQEILLRLESRTPLLIVEGLAIEPLAASDGSSDQEQILHADVTIDGYWIGPRK